MERFEMMINGDLVDFKSFLSKTKDSINSLIEDIMTNISTYESRIKDTENDIKETENSSYTCEQEILRQQERIKSLKKSIENVEKTYKKMVDAYSSTSEGNTKDLYSDIIENARENCERDVEKNNAEIDTINDTIYGIKNNIKEFNSTIDRLNRDLEEYQIELAKYTKSLQYMQKVYDGVIEDLSDVDSGKNNRITTNSRKNEPVHDVESVNAESLEVVDTENIEKSKSKVLETEANEKSDQIENNEEKELDKVETNPVYSVNLENLFLKIEKDDKKADENKSVATEFNGNELSEWEKMLNEKTLTFDAPIKGINNDVDTVNQLLKPYGTTYERLINLTDNQIEYKDGTSSYIDVTINDILNVINKIDSIDLKSMKIIGPETTILKKIKKLKEEAQ